MLKMVPLFGIMEDHENNRFAPNYVESQVSSAVLEIIQIVRQCNIEKQKLQMKHYTKIDGIVIKFDKHRL